MSQLQIKTIDAYTTFQQCLATYHIIMAGIRTGILNQLESGQRTSKQIAEDLQLDPWKTELLCSALTQTGLVERYDDDFALSNLARMLPLGDPLDSQWHGIESSIAQATPTETTLDDLPKSTITADQWTRTPAALDAIEALDIGKSRRAFRILEIGGGAAVFGAAFAHRDPDCRITLLDSAESLKLARQTTDGIGVSGQFEFTVGDYRSPALPKDQFDMVIAVGLLRYFNAKQCNEWLRHLCSALKSEGDLVLVDWFHGQERGAKYLAFGELEMTLQTNLARMHSPPELRTWMMDAGLNNIQFAHLPSPPHCWGLIVGQKS